MARKQDEQRAEEVNEEERDANKLEILGKLPKYQRGALDD